ncbi:hypothetical protein [Kutzneria kofuensis]|uniref:Transaldolase n=1 Tax=Kutzneria kofuensis TaxID=103725 RepID=A0A7W9KAZ3_9PSEU|nr:hypothetical protein [Kutzneria kofuensis]MBB5888828.1 hypothetical protein [Kutzneria kofuensis]
MEAGGAVAGLGSGRQDGHAFLTARTTLGDVVGFSTACFTPPEFPVAALACQAHGGNAVEIVCGESTRLDALVHACDQLRRHGLRPSVHAFGSVEHLVSLNVPVVVPADLASGSLTRLVLLRNTGDPDLVDKALAAHPTASFCLDASVAFAAGGFIQLKSLASRHADRLSQINVGADPDAVDLVRTCFDAAGRAVPVILERPGSLWSESLSCDVERLRALARRFLTPYR